MPFAVELSTILLIAGSEPPPKLGRYSHQRVLSLLTEPHLLSNLDGEMRVTFEKFKLLLSANKSQSCGIMELTFTEVTDFMLVAMQAGAKRAGSLAGGQMWPASKVEALRSQVVLMMLDEPNADQSMTVGLTELAAMFKREDPSS